MSYRNSDDGFSLFSLPVIYLVGIVIVVAGLILAAYMWLGAQRGMNDLETQNTRHSIGYIDAHNSHMRDLIVQYKSDQKDLIIYANNQDMISNTNAHMKSILNDVRTSANELDSKDVATDVQQFLADHKNDN